MKLIKKIIAMAGLSLFTVVANAEICDNVYQSLPFYLVKIGYGRVACYYGDYKNDIFYEKLGEYVPLAGPWRDDGSPFVVGCLSNNSADCEFQLQG